MRRNDDDGRKVICLTHHSRLERWRAPERISPAPKRDLWGAARMVDGSGGWLLPVEAVCIIWGYMRVCVLDYIYLYACSPPWQRYIFVQVFLCDIFL